MTTGGSEGRESAPVRAEADEILTWNAQAPITSADAAADAVSAWVEGAEVHQLGTGGSGVARRTGAAVAQTRALWGAAAVIMAGAGSTGIHPLLTRGALIP